MTETGTGIERKNLQPESRYISTSWSTCMNSFIIDQQSSEMLINKQPKSNIQLSLNEFQKVMKYQEFSIILVGHRFNNVERLAFSSTVNQGAFAGYQRCAVR